MGKKREGQVVPFFAFVNSEGEEGKEDRIGGGGRRLLLPP